MAEKSAAVKHLEQKLEEAKKYDENRDGSRLLNTVLILALTALAGLVVVAISEMV